MRTALVLWFLVLPVCAQTVEDAALTLARRISRIAVPGSLQLAVENRSSLSTAYADRIRAVLERELKPSQTGAALTVTISESLAGPLLVASVGSGDSAQVAIERFAADAPGGFPAVLDLRPVLKQQGPVLDFAFDGGTLFVLEPDRVVAGGETLQLSSPPSRDPRGRLFVRDGAILAHLTGTTCSGTGALTCGPPKTWRENGIEVGWNRNRLTSDPYPAAQGWDDVAALTSACGNAVTASPDGLRVLQAGRPASAPVPLPGPVTALWPSENPAEVSVVVHNRTTGDYEAARAAVRCQ
jgi:hypothetical protein